MVADEGFVPRVGLKAGPVLRIRCGGGLAETVLSHHEEHEAHGAWSSADFRRFRFMNQEKRKSGNGAVGLKLVRRPRSLAAILAVLPSISEVPFLDSAFLRSCFPD